MRSIRNAPVRGRQLGGGRRRANIHGRHYSATATESTTTVPGPALSIRTPASTIDQRKPRCCFDADRRNRSADRNLWHFVIFFFYVLKSEGGGCGSICLCDHSFLFWFQSATYGWTSVRFDWLLNYEVTFFDFRRKRHKMADPVSKCDPTAARNRSRR